jgi:hypothetical protein
MGGKTVGRQSWLRWGNRSDKRNRLDRYALHWRSAMHTGWWRKLVNGELAERHASVELVLHINGGGQPFRSQLIKYL